MNSGYPIGKHHHDQKTTESISIFAVKIIDSGISYYIVRFTKIIQYYLLFIKLGHFLQQING